jgi:polyisoprenoid-binding protein YceI
MSTTWTIDPTHTQIEFSVRHMGLSTVRGRFNAFEGTVETDADGRPNAIAVDIETASIDTNNADRDAHLRSGDFFDAEANPTITFRSTAVTPRGGDRYVVTGDLTMHGVTHSIELDAEIGSAITDPFGLRRRAATASAVKPQGVRLHWNQILEAGALLVSEEVKLSLDVQVTAAEAVEAMEAVPA